MPFPLFCNIKAAAVSGNLSRKPPLSETSATPKFPKTCGSLSRSLPAAFPTPYYYSFSGSPFPQCPPSSSPYIVTVSSSPPLSHLIIADMSLTIKLHTHNQHRPDPPIARLSRPRSLNPAKIRPSPIYHTNALSPLVYSRRPGMSSSASNLAARPPIKSSLIDPDGGALVDLVVPEAEVGPKTQEAESLPKVQLTRIDLEWVHVISEGWASPLKGFMREKEYLQSLHFNCLRTEDGSMVNMSLPIVLAIDDDTKEAIGSSPNVALLGPGGGLVSILQRSVCHRFSISGQRSNILLLVLSLSGCLKKFDQQHCLCPLV